MIARRRITVTVFLAALFLPRLVANDPYTLLDEPRWLVRAGDYLRDLEARNWTSLYSPGYPGITMLITMAPVVAAYRDAFGQSPETVEAWDLPHRQRALRWARLAVGIVTGFLGLWIFSLLRRTALLGRDAVLAGAVTLFVVNEPWVLGMSRTALMDAYLSLFLLISLVAVVVARETQSAKPLVASGIAWGLAFLTKTPALFFPPLILLLLLRRPLKTSVRPVLVWMVSSLATILVLWPALWVHPIEQLADLFFWSQDQVVHPEPHYWPGWHPPFLFVALSLPTLLGIFWYLWSRFRETLSRSHQPGIMLADFAFLGGSVFQVLMMYFVADRSRWILPALVFFTVPGAVGIFRLLTSLRLRPRTAALAMVAAQTIYALLWFPFLTLHMNPLFRTEPATWQFSMGEGYQEVATYFNALPGRLLVATKAPGSLQPYLQEPDRVQLTRFPRSGELAELPPEVTHIVVPWGLRNRTKLSYDQSAARAFAWVDARTPIHRVSIRGVPLYGIFQR